MPLRPRDDKLLGTWKRWALRQFSLMHDLSWLCMMQKHFKVRLASHHGTLMLCCPPYKWWSTCIMRVACVMAYNSSDSMLMHILMTHTQAASLVFKNVDPVHTPLQVSLMSHSMQYRRSYMKSSCILLQALYCSSAVLHTWKASNTANNGLFNRIKRPLGLCWARSGEGCSAS